MFKCQTAGQKLFRPHVETETQFPNIQTVLELTKIWLRCSDGARSEERLCCRGPVEIYWSILEVISQGSTRKQISSVLGKNAQLEIKFSFHLTMRTHLS
jgi:hypothetical protein